MDIKLFEGLCVCVCVVPELDIRARDRQQVSSILLHCIFEPGLTEMGAQWDLVILTVHWTPGSSCFHFPSVRNKSQTKEHLHTDKGAPTHRQMQFSLQRKGVSESIQASKQEVPFVFILFIQARCH